MFLDHKQIALKARQKLPPKQINNYVFFFYFQHRNTQETLAVLDRLDLDTEKPTDEEVAKKFGFEDAYNKGKVNWWQHLKPQMWSLFDEPYSSNAAKVSTSVSVWIKFRPRLLIVKIIVDSIIVWR